MSSAFDTRAWLVWLAAAALLALRTSNPLYLLILLLAAAAVGATCGLPQTGLQLSLWRLGLVILALSTLINALTLHVGETVLFRLPAAWPLLGGPITLEAAVYGAINGLILLTLLALFVTFSAVTPVSELVQLTPRAFHDLGLVVLIALTYLPETRQQLARIREAQAVRGHQLRGWRDWRPLAIPLLIGGLERAMNLAETMVARGYGATAEARQTRRLQLIFLAALLLAFGGWVVVLWRGWPGWLLLLLGAVLMTVVLRRLGQQTHHTRYRWRVWTRRDTLLTATAAAVLLLALLPWPFVARETLSYSPFPALTAPPFDPLLGAALALLALPAGTGRDTSRANLVGDE